jgi:transcriptional regulator with XRE-family HTH domain
MRQVKPLPANYNLAPTLARRVFQLREFRNLTVKDLARWSRFTLKRIEDIEAGMESWLSSTDRQRLAKALNVEPWVLEEVETRYYQDDAQLRQAQNEQLTLSILAGYRQLNCPDCGADLKCSIQEGFDLEGKPIRLAKAFCLKCPYVLR